MKKSCCFIGHRKIALTNDLEQWIKQTVEELILEGFEIFYFCSKSDFVCLCWDVVTSLKIKYPSIRRVTVRVDYLEFQQFYIDYLHERYEDIYTSEKIIKSGRLAYIIANQEMINLCDVVVCYFNDNNFNNGTRQAVKYAQSKHKKVINFL